MVQKTSTDGGLKKPPLVNQKPPLVDMIHSKTHLRKTPKLFSDRGESRSLALAVIPHGAPAPDGAAPEDFKTASLLRASAGDLATRARRRRRSRRMEGLRCRLQQWRQRPRRDRRGDPRLRAQMARRLPERSEHAPAAVEVAQPEHLEKSAEAKAATQWREGFAGGYRISNERGQRQMTNIVPLQNTKLRPLRALNKFTNDADWLVDRNDELASLLPQTKEAADKLRNGDEIAACLLTPRSWRRSASAMRSASPAATRRWSGSIRQAPTRTTTASGVCGEMWLCERVAVMVGSFPNGAPSDPAMPTSRQWSRAFPPSMICPCQRLRPRSGRSSPP